MADEAKSITALAMELKPKHLAFANAVMQGEKSYTDCYLETCVDPDSEPPKRPTAGAAASRLLGNPKVRAYIEAVTGAAIDAVIVTRAELLAQLRDVAFSGVTQGPGAGARVTASVKLLEIIGEATPIVRHEHSGPDGKPMQTVTHHRGLSSEQIEALKIKLLGLPTPETP